jgi:hypothetical protein
LKFLRVDDIADSWQAAFDTLEKSLAVTLARIYDVAQVETVPFDEILLQAN